MGCLTRFVRVWLIGKVLGWVRRLLGGQRGSG